MYTNYPVIHILGDLDVMDSENIADKGAIDKANVAYKVVVPMMDSKTEVNDTIPPE